MSDIQRYCDNEKKMTSLKNLTIELIKRANDYKKDEQECNVCNPDSEKEYLCGECIKHGWELR